MNPISKVVFPAPPPTLNRLSSQQRALLMRKAKKIEQVLGVPPQLVDIRHKETGRYPISETYGLPTVHCAVNFRSSRHSIYSSSTASNGLFGDATRFDPCKERQSVSIRRNKSPVQDRKNPVMNLVSRSLSFNYTTPPRAQSTRPPSMSNIAFTTPSPRTPTFTIPTTNSLRKAKMDRLRKKLGSGVPIELVFRENGAQRPSCDSSIRRSSNGVQDAATTRDATHTRCESNNHLLPRPRNTLKRSTTSRLKAEHPRSMKGPTIDVSPPGGSITDFGPVKGRLPFIQESPDERLPGLKEVVIKLPTVKQFHNRPGKGDTQLSCRSSHRVSSCESWMYDSGANTIPKRSPSYRKPPPPITEN